MEKTMELELTPDMIPVISKQNARTFHNQVKDRIKETGEGLFEYLETLKFFEKLKEVISGNSQSKNPEEQEGDKELKQMVRDEIVKYGKGFETKRGVKFDLSETGTKYDYSKCGDPVIIELGVVLESAKIKIKERQEFLQTVPVEGLDILTEGGEVSKIYPPSKSSTSSYKITLPK